MTPRFSISKTWTNLPADFVSKVKMVFTDEFKSEALKGEFVVDGRIYPDELLVRLGYLEKGRLKQVNFEASMDLKPGKAMMGLDLDRDLDSIEGSPLEDEDDIYDTESARVGRDEDDDLSADDDLQDELLDPEEREIREKKKSETATERLYACVDALGSLMEEYFELGSEKDMDIPPVWRPYEFEGDMIYMQHNNINTQLEDEANRLLGLVSEELVNEEEVSEDALRRSKIDSDLAFEIQKSIREGSYEYNGAKPFAHSNGFGAGSGHEHSADLE